MTIRSVIGGEERVTAVPEMEIAEALGGLIRLVSTASDRRGVKMPEEGEGPAGP